MSADARQAPVPPAADLVGALVRDLVPVAPVRFARTLATVVALELIVVAATAWILGARVAGMERLADPRFAALLAVLALGAGASAAAMASLSIPGRAVGAAWRGTVIVLPLALALFMVAASPWGGTWTGFSAVLVEGFGCTRNTLLVAAPAWIAGLLYLRRLRPLDPLRVGLFSGFSALLTAALAVQMACPSCDSWHLAVAHYAPILIAGWLAAALSPLVLARGAVGDAPGEVIHKAL